MFKDCVDDLTEAEQTELAGLMTYQVLLSTDPKEWREHPTDFIPMSIPQNLKDYAEEISDNPADLISRIINDMVIKGIEAITRDFVTPTAIQEKIDSILDKGITSQ